MMARYNRGMALRPVHRIKHVVDSSATAAAAANTPVILIKSVDAPVLGNTSECETGSKVNGIYLRVEVASNETEDVGAIPNVYMSVTKNPAAAISIPAPNNVGANSLKKYVIHQEMVMIENSKGGNSKTLFNGVIKIPRGYIRNGPLDQLVLTVLSPAIDIAFCVQCHYKEFR